MFAELLTTDERHHVLDLLAYLAHIDGLTDAEKSHLAQISNRLDIADYDVFTAIADMSLEAVCAEFKRDKAKRIAVVELIHIGLSDGHYSDSERRGTEKIAALMGLEAHVVSELESWVQEGLAWQRRGDEVLGLR